MAYDLAGMKARIADELARSDLTTQIESAIFDAIAIYQKERFRFSDTIPLTPPTFNTVANQWIYTAADNTNIGSTLKIDKVWAQVGGMLQDLSLVDPKEVRQYNQLGTMHGQPMWWAYEGNSLLISPVPDNVYAMTLDIFRLVPAPATDTEADNPWMTPTNGERLIRSRAKYEIALHVTRNTSMQEAMSPEEPPAGKASGHASWRAWAELKREAARVTSKRRIRAMPF